MVLYQVTVTASPSTKKGGGKELQLTPGESLDVISKAVDNKLICRNNEGKCMCLQQRVYSLTPPLPSSYIPAPMS